jgi:hypothetical protein
MSYDNNENRNEVKVFSVTMTEEELRSFSNWLDEYKKEEEEYLKELSYKPGSGYTTLAHARRVKDGSLQRMQAVRGYLTAKKTNDAIKTKYIPEDKKDYYRMSDKINKGVEKNQEELDRIAEKHGYRSNEFKNALEKSSSDLTRSSDAIMNENRLRKSGYDDRYSSKFMERVLNKKIDSNDASKITSHRTSANNSYEKDSEGNIIKGKFVDELKRHYKDADIVYGSAFDGHSLGKDAAIATGVTAALVGGGVALRKHLKRKRLEKEIAENKFKTSDKKKK